MTYPMILEPKFVQEEISIPSQLNQASLPQASVKLRCSRSQQLRLHRAGAFIGFVAGILSADCCAQDWLPAKRDGSIRVATYNVSLNRRKAGQLADDLAAGPQAKKNAKIRAVAAVIRAVKPDILLLNEVDYSAESNNAETFSTEFVQEATPDALGGQAWVLPNVFDGPVNTGVPSGLDLNQNDSTQDPEDAYGYGVFPGQYGMAVLSRFPIDQSEVATLQNLKWSQMPNALRPRADGQDFYYDDATWKELRIASKSFWDVPLATPLGKLHVLASHPTPPAFDGPEDRNGCRNHDEIRLIQDYIENQDYIFADSGQRAGLTEEDEFVVMGDLNSDPSDGGSRSSSIKNLLSHPRIVGDSVPTSNGAVEAAKRQGGANRNHKGDPASDTGDFSDRSVGNLRIDYVLPSRGFSIVASGVFWPTLDEVEPELREAMKACLNASDHHLVWVDLIQAN